MSAQKRRPEYGQRVPREARERFEAYVERVIAPSGSDSRDEKARKERIREKLEHYENVVHPAKSSLTRMKRNRNSRYLTMQSLPDYLDAVEIPYKTFYEFCIGANRNLKGPEDEGWTELTWPTETMAEMSDVLGACSPREKKSFADLIERLQPEFYRDFRNSLLADSGENLQIGRAASSRTEEDSEIPIMTKEDNMSDRLVGTVNYICDERRVLPKLVCKEKDLAFTPKRVYAARHYWAAFEFEDLWLFCKEFQISPHWAMFGTAPAKILTDSEESEQIMDEFAFLPEDTQEIVLAAAKRKLGRKI